MTDFIFASSSLEKNTLLESIGYRPDRNIRVTTNIVPEANESPVHLSKRIANKKAKIASDDYPGSIVLTSTTVLSRGRLILSKPQNNSEAEQYFRSLSGRKHIITTAVCATVNEKYITRAAQIKVKFKLLTNQEIINLIHYSQWNNIEIGYQLEGIAACYIINVYGHPSTALGLPIYETHKILSGAGVKQIISTK